MLKTKSSLHMEKHLLTRRFLLLCQLVPTVALRREADLVRLSPTLIILCLVHDDFLASKFMIDTGAGVIDADYRGVVFVLLFNLSDKDFEGNLIFTFFTIRALTFLGSQRGRSDSTAHY